MVFRGQVACPAICRSPLQLRASLVPFLHDNPLFSHPALQLVIALIVKNILLCLQTIPLLFTPLSSSRYCWIAQVPAFDPRRFLPFASSAYRNIYLIQARFLEEPLTSLCLLLQNSMKASQSLRDTMSSGIHSWNSQADGQSFSWNNLLNRSRHTDTPSYFNGESEFQMFG